MQAAAPLAPVKRVSVTCHRRPQCLRLARTFAGLGMRVSDG